MKISSYQSHVLKMNFKILSIIFRKLGFGTGANVHDLDYQAGLGQTSSRRYGLLPGLGSL